MRVSPFVLIAIFFAPIVIGMIIGRIVSIKLPTELVYLAGGLFAGAHILALFTMHASELWGLWVPEGMLLCTLFFLGYDMGYEDRRDERVQEKARRRSAAAKFHRTTDHGRDRISDATTA